MDDAQSKVDDAQSVVDDAQSKVDDAQSKVDDAQSEAKPVSEAVRGNGSCGMGPYYRGNPAPFFTQRQCTPQKLFVSGNLRLFLFYS